MCCALVLVRAAGGGRPVRVLTRLAGPLVALALLAAAASRSRRPSWARRSYAAVNAHNLLFTALMPEIGPDVVTAAVGLPPGAALHSGEGYYVAGGMDVPGWATAVGDRPSEATATAHTLLLEHPAALAAMVGNGLTATMRPQLTYLPSAPRGTAPEHFEGRTVYPEAGPETVLLKGWLANIGAGRLPLATVLAALAAGAATLLPRVRRADPLAVGLARVAAATALLGLGVVTLAVLGDGFYDFQARVAGLVLRPGRGPDRGRRGRRRDHRPLPPPVGLTGYPNPTAVDAGTTTNWRRYRSRNVTGPRGPGTASMLMPVSGTENSLKPSSSRVVEFQNAPVPA